LLRWQYFEPPAGQLFADFAVTPGTDPRLAAIYAVFPVAMRVEGRRALGVQSLNTLTDVAFRGKGLFTRLAEAIYERSARAGVEVVYGFPNGSSAHGIFNKLAWKSFDPMPMMVRPLRAGWVIARLTRGNVELPGWLDLPVPRRRARLPKGWKLQTLSGIGDELTGIWQRFSADIGFGVERDRQYLQWRLRKPGASYEVVGAFRDERLLGFVIITVSGRTGKIMDLLYDPAEPAAGTYLLAEAMHRLSKAGCGGVWAWNYDHSRNHGIFRSAGFLPLPARMIANQAHSGARSLVTPPSPAAAERRNWYVSMLDSDTD
jgi:GNAT superfamily N-acetyltransferase